MGYTGPGGNDEDGIYFNCTGGIARKIDITIFGNSHIFQNPSCK